MTLLGFIHICYQPYFTHVINSSLSMNKMILEQYKIVMRLCFVGGTMLLLRHLIYGYFPGWQTPISSDYTDFAKTKVNLKKSFFIIYCFRKLIKKLFFQTIKINSTYFKFYFHSHSIFFTENIIQLKKLSK